MKRKTLLAATFLIGSILSSPVLAEDHGNLDDVQVSMLDVSDNIHMIMGKGGNIGISVGQDGVFMIDDQFAPLTAQIEAIITRVSRKPIRFLLNTHFHFDHVGGNAFRGETGTVILAQENVRKRLSTDQFIEFFKKEQKATDEYGLPVITFTDNIKLHLNGEDIEVIHFPHAHTDGDAVVYFPQSNVIHTGDIYFAAMYPFFDTPNGGSIEGIISAVDAILTKTNDETKIIPGHGPLSNTKELKAYRDMLQTVKERIEGYIAEKKSLKQIIAAQPTKEFDDTHKSDLLTPDQFVTLVYNDLTADHDHEHNEHTHTH